ncbi:MAG: RsmB/NOP family class I SAM-dependent RNA methyltransferase, partial [Alphaproteobacteria bacterium]
RSHRFAGSGDRAAIGNLVFDALRKRASLGWCAEDDTPTALALAVAIFEWNNDAETVIADCKADPHGPRDDKGDELSAALQALLLSGGRPLDQAPDAVRADLPLWLAPQMAAALGDNWVAECAALAERPPLDIRVNRLKTDRDAAIKQLARYNPQVSDRLPDAIRIPPTQGAGRTANIRTDPTYLRGRIEIQDLGSQICARLVGAQPGEQVLDYCAGAGGKTLALAAAMDNKGQIFAHDADRNRLAPIFERLKRAEVRNAQVISPGKRQKDGPSEPARDSQLGQLLGKMDRVLVDAPCTGTGVWRRRPEAKWRLGADQLEKRIAEQTAILGDSASFVRPGGRLVYVTCSLLADENEAVAASFLAGQGGFSQSDLQAEARSRAPKALSGRSNAAPHVRLSPLSTGTDGFFIAEFQKIDG